MAVTKAQVKARAKPEAVKAQAVKAQAPAASKHDRVASKAAKTKAAQDMDKRLKLLDGICEDGLNDVKSAMALVSYGTLVETARNDFGMRMTGRKSEDYARVYKAYICLTQAPDTKDALARMTCDELRCVAREASLRGFGKAVKAELVAMIMVRRRALERFVESKAGAAEPEESAECYDFKSDEDTAES